MQNGPRKIPRT
jgi:hypothetical protein